MRLTRIMLPLLATLALAAGCAEQKPAPEAQHQAQKAPQQKIEAAKPAPAPAEKKPEAEKVVASEPLPQAEAPAEIKPEPATKTEPEKKPEPAAKTEPKPKPRREIAKVTPKVEPSARSTTIEKTETTDEAATEKYVLPELPKVELPNFEYPTFNGRKLTFVFTGNVIGELEPCG
jgi:outer membrane biosynthesis protein TonB